MHDFPPSACFFSLFHGRTFVRVRERCVREKRGEERRERERERATSLKNKATTKGAAHRRGREGAGRAFQPIVSFFCVSRFVLFRSLPLNCVRPRRPRPRSTRHGQRVSPDLYDGTRGTFRIGERGEKERDGGRYEV